MGDILLSQKEARRLYCLEKLTHGGLTAGEASELLGMSVRQVFRLKAKLATKGLAGLAHGNRGRKPPHAIPEELASNILMLATGLYRGASCTHMSELLEEHDGVMLSAKSIGRVLRRSGVALAHTHRSPRKRRRRQRRTQEGLLVQMDASPHDWLEDRGPRLSLHGIIDDATSKVLGLHFRLNEDARGYFIALEQMIRRHGVPRYLYTDLHSMFVSSKSLKLTVEEELDGRTVPLTQIGTALDALGIGHIKARSPQAKGRIERLWGTLQSRLTIELRLAGVSTIEEANAFLPAFIERFNARFGVPATDPTPAFAEAPSPNQLKKIFVFRYTRRTCNASSISYNGKTYRLHNSNGQAVALPPKSEVVVKVTVSGKVFATAGQRDYALKEFQAPTPPPRPVPPPVRPPTNNGPRKPAHDHPWKTGKPYRTPSDQTDHERICDLVSTKGL